MAKRKTKTKTRRPKFKTKGKPNRSGRRLPAEIERAVVVAKMQGKSNRQIAKEIGITKETVGRVLSREEYQDLLRKHRSAALDYAGDAIDLLNRQVQAGLTRQKKKGYKGNLPAGAISAATTLAEGSQVLVKRQQTDMSQAQPGKTAGIYGEGDYADKSDDEIAFALNFGRFPSPEEKEYKAKHGYWPQDDPHKEPVREEVTH